jgi:hypothetical protein
MHNIMIFVKSWKLDYFLGFSKDLLSINFPHKLIVAFFKSCLILVLEYVVV